MGVQAEKTMYKPDSWTYDSSTETYTETGVGEWKKSHSRESTNCILFWQTDFGNDPTNAPALNGTDMTFDPDAVLEVAETCYALNVTTLGFSCSNMVDKYKIIILMNYTDTWTCYGGGYDFECSALWLNPATVKPAGHSLAHEVGHSFHYMAYAAAANYSHTSSASINTGFHLACGNGQAIWEQTAQWQANQAYPAEMFSQSYPLFGNCANYAFSHEWMRYQSYWFHYYLSDYYNDKTIVSQIWKQPMTGQSAGNATDFCQAYIALKGLTAAEFYERYFDYALHCATFDFTEAASYRDDYVGNFDYRCAQLGEKQYQVAYHSAPQSTGFNVIELDVPSSGTTITTAFKALQHGCALNAKDPATYNDGVANASISTGVKNYNSAGTASYRGFRVGYVFLKTDGTREYVNDNTVHCTGTAETTENISTTVPANTSRIFLVVAPALTTYVKHPWDEDISNDDQWPYNFTLTGTDLKTKSQTVVYTEDIPNEPEFTKQIDGRSIADVTLTYNVTLPPDASEYTGTTLTVKDGALNALATAFQMEGDNIFNNAVAYNSSQSNGTIMNYAVNASDNLQSNESTAGGDFGYWFNASGDVTNWGNNSVVYIEFTKSSKSVVIGQYPGANSAGTTRTIRDALVYKDANGNTARATIVFNITFKTGAAAIAYLSAIDYTKPAPTTVNSTSKNTKVTTGAKVPTGTNNADFAVSIKQGNSYTYTLTSSDLSTIKTTLQNPTSFDTRFKDTSYFYDYTTPSSSMNTSRYYYFAFNNAPITSATSISYYPTTANKNDSDMGSNVYTHYYYVTGENEYAVVATSNAWGAHFRIGYDVANAKYVIMVDEDCPAGTYSDVRLGVIRYTNSKYYAAYVTFDITVTEPETNTYTINMAAGAPAGAGFTTQNGLTGSGNTYSITDTQITAENVADYVSATAVTGYETSIAVEGTTITISYIATEETLNVERYPGQGYTVTAATVDFTAAKTYLGVSEVTTDMLRIVNPDGQFISDYASFDGWFNAEGAAEVWAPDGNSKINVKFFQAIPNGTYTICNMDGADVVGTTYTTKWALVSGEKTYTYNINVTFVEKPAAEITLNNLTQVGSDVVINLTSSLGSSYEELTSDVDVDAILSTLSVSSLNDVTIYAVQSDGSLDDSYKTGSTNGWRNADGDWQSWGDDARFCVKVDFTAETEIYYVGGMVGQNTTDPATYTATYAFVKNGSETNDAVILKVNLIYPAAEVGPTVIAYTKTIYVQSRETESLRIPVTDADFTSFGLTLDQLRTKLTATHSANNNSIGVANHTLDTDEVMLYPADYTNETVDQTQGVNYNDNGHWFDDEGFVSATDGEIAIALDWIGNSWVIYQKANTLTAGNEYEVANALLYNDGTETKTIIFKYDITVEDMPSITLADTQESYEQQSGNYNVTLQRSLPAGKWLTFCAPFNIGAGEWSDMGIQKVMKLGSVTHTDNSITLNFTEVTDGIWVGIPVIIQMSETKTGITKTETSYGAYDFHPTTTVESTDGNVSAQFIGTYVKMALPNDVYYIQDDKFRHTTYTGTAVTNMKGWRGYFTITDNSQTQGVKELGMTFNDEEVPEEATLVEGLEVVLNDRVDVYSVSGVKVKSGVLRLDATEGLPAGIYLVGGKKVAVK